MKTLRVDQVEKASDQANNQTVLEVSLSILDEAGEVVDNRKLAFPLDTTKEALDGELVKFITTYNADEALAAASAAQDAINAQADGVISELTGAVVAPEVTNV